MWKMGRFFSLPATHRILNDAQEGIAVAGGFLLAHTADIQQFVGAQRLFLHHLPQGVMPPCGFFSTISRRVASLNTIQAGIFCFPASRLR